jgi:hypothetical protein
MSRLDRLSPYKTKVMCTNGHISVVYHETLIVEATPNTVTLDTGGWRSVTTKRKMNQAARQFGLGYGVHQRKGEWYVSRWNARTSEWCNERPFDGDTFVFIR